MEKEHPIQYTYFQIRKEGSSHCSNQQTTSLLDTNPTAFYLDASAITNAEGIRVGLEYTVWEAPSFSKQIKEDLI